MNKLMGWTQNVTNDKIWERLLLTKRGPFICARITESPEEFRASAILLSETGDITTHNQSFLSFEDAQEHLNREIKKMGV